MLLYILIGFIDPALEGRYGGGLRRPNRTPNYSKGKIINKNYVIIINSDIQIMMKGKNDCLILQIYTKHILSFRLHQIIYLSCTLIYIVNNKYLYIYDRCGTNVC